VIWLYLSSPLLVGLVGGCRCSADRAAPPPPPPAIEVRDATGAVTARVVPGRPCRANVGDIELLVGGRPLLAQEGAVRWTGEDAANGTTLFKDGAPVARYHARQLFDAEGLPLLRVLDDGSIVDRASVVVRRAAVGSAAAATTGSAAAAAPTTGPAAAPTTGPAAAATTGSAAAAAPTTGPAAAPTTGAVTIGDVTVTGTTDVVLAAMLAAPEAPPAVRALVACHLLLPEAR
jgi:hypothetical protein